MKTISKSQVMKRAWSIFRQSAMVSWRIGGMSFGRALRLAWKEIKEEIAKLNRVTRVVKIEDTHSPEFHEGIRAYYENAPRGTYFGD